MCVCLSLCACVHVCVRIRVTTITVQEIYLSGFKCLIVRNTFAHTKYKESEIFTSCNVIFILINMVDYV